MVHSQPCINLVYPKPQDLQISTFRNYRLKQRSGNCGHSPILLKTAAHTLEWRCLRPKCQSSMSSLVQKPEKKESLPVARTIPAQPTLTESPKESDAGIGILCLWGLHCVVFCAVFADRPLWHTDLWDHINYGRSILSHSTLPDVEPLLSLSAEPMTWTAWGSQVFAALTMTLGGYGLSVLQLVNALLIVLAMWFLCLNTWKRSKISAAISKSYWKNVKLIMPPRLLHKLSRHPRSFQSIYPASLPPTNLSAL